MKDKELQFFEKTDFDNFEPHSGHLDRFERKLHQQKQVKISWKWLSVAASVVLLLGFWLGNTHQKRTLDLADVSPKMKEVQQYFKSTIYQEIKEVEKYRTANTEKIIEDSLTKLEELEQNYQILTKDLTLNGNQKQIIRAMIHNYQQRLTVLQNLLTQLEKIQKKHKRNHENNIS